MENATKGRRSVATSKRYHVVMATVTFVSGVVAVIVAVPLLKRKLSEYADDTNGNFEILEQNMTTFKETETAVKYHGKLKANSVVSSYGQAGGERDFLFGVLPKMDSSRLREPDKEQAEYLHYNCGRRTSATEPRVPWLVSIAVLNPNASDKALTLKKMAERNRKIRNNETKIERVISVCGAVLVAPFWGLTAHHCLSKHRFLKVVLHSRSNFKNVDGIRNSVVEIQRVYFHQDYDDKLNQHDIALFKLMTKIQFGDKVQPACLPNSDVIPKTGKVCRYSGWGIKSHKARNRFDGSNTNLSNSGLVQFEVSIEDPGRCQKRYKRLKYDVNYNLCDSGRIAGDFGTGLPEDVQCSGFSGSPLTCLEHGRWVAYGIVNWGDESCDLSVGRGYALVSTKMKWICCTAKLDIANCNQFNCADDARQASDIA